MQSVDWNAAYFWLSLAQWVAVIAVGAYAHVKQRRQATKNEIAAVEKRMEKRAEELTDRLNNHAERLTNGDHRFTRLEDSIERLPSNEAIYNLQLQLERLAGDLRTTNETMKGAVQRQEMVADQVRVIDEFLRAKT